MPHPSVEKIVSGFLMKNIKLRLATPGDGNFLFDLYKTTRQEEMRLTGWDAARIEAFLQTQYTIRRNQYDARFPRAQNWIILLGKQPAGRHLIQPGESVWAFIDLAILPKYQNIGIATFVLRDHLRQATESGASARLTVRIDNRAVHLYERLNFVITGQSDMYCEMETHDTPPSVRRVCIRQ